MADEASDGAETTAAPVDESVCWRCGKGKRTDEAIQFCPYCGARFDASPTAQEMAVPLSLVLAGSMAAGVMLLALWVST